jgi:hypothetical protein
MSLSNPLKSALSPLRAMDIQAFARGDASGDFDTHGADISVNDTLLASKIPVAASATHPQRKRTSLAIAMPSSPMSRPMSRPMLHPILRHPSRQWLVPTPRWAAHAAATAQVPHD